MTNSLRAHACLTPGREGKGREEEGNKTCGARHASIVTSVTREGVNG